MFAGTMYNSCKTMSLHVRRLSVSFMECQEKETGLQVYMDVWGQQRVSHLQGTMYNSADKCKTMSLHVRMLNALHAHPSMYKRQFPDSFSAGPSFYKTYEGTTPTVYSPGSTPASTTAAWAHLRALRDTGNTCHGSRDLAEGSSRAHTCTTCPWNAKRRRQDYRCTWMYEDSRGCPTSSGDKQAIRATHRVHAEL